MMNEMTEKMQLLVKTLHAEGINQTNIGEGELGYRLSVYSRSLGYKVRAFGNTAGFAIQYQEACEELEIVRKLAEGGCLAEQDLYGAQAEAIERTLERVIKLAGELGL